MTLNANVVPCLLADSVDGSKWTECIRAFLFAFQLFRLGVIISSGWSDHKWDSSEYVGSHIALQCISTCIPDHLLSYPCSVGNQAHTEFLFIEMYIKFMWSTNMLLFCSSEGSIINFSSPSTSLNLLVIRYSKYHLSQSFPKCLLMSCLQGDYLHCYENKKNKKLLN